MTLRAFQLGLFALVALFIGVYAFLMPGLTRRDVFFGVTVAPDARATPAGRRILARYRAAVAALTLLALALLAAAYAFLPDDVLARPWVSLGVIAVALLVLVPYLPAHLAARRLAAPRDATASAAAAPTAELRPRRYGDYVPWLWELLPLVLIAATAAYLASQYAAAPDIIPTHYDINGRPNAYAPKSVSSFFALVWTQLFLELLLTAVSVLIVGAKSVPGQADTRFRRMWIRALFGLKTLTIAFLGMLAAIIAANVNSPTLGPGVYLITTVVYLVVVLAGVLVLALRTGQGGSRLGTPAETAIDRTDDRYWIGGIVYVNRDDPAVVVERRFGIGWTLNLGNPRGVLMLVLTLLAVAGFAALSILLKGHR